MLRYAAAAPEARERGFTLIELLVTIVVLGILAGIAVPIFLNNRRKAHQALAKGDLASGYGMIRAYYVILDGDTAPTFDSGKITSTVTMPDGEIYRVSPGDRAYISIDPTGGPHTGFCMVVITSDNDHYWANDTQGLFTTNTQTGQGACTAISHRQNL